MFLKKIHNYTTGGGMNNKSFDSHRIAEGYAKRPWLHKGVIDRFRKDCDLPEDYMFSNGLDVGCGAGLSTKALKTICRHVTGTDIAESMVEVCNELYGSDEAYSFYTAGAEDTLIPDEKYDVVSAAGMVNWVDEKKFMENLIEVTKDECFIIIYDFWITDKMKNVPEYTRWYQDEYLKRFPKPPRKENIWTDADLINGLKMYKQINYELIYSFSLDDFIDFMMIQSNVNAKIESGEMVELQVRRWMKDTLSPIFKDKEQELIFDGYTWYIKR